MPQIGTLGRKQDLLIKQGADFWVRATLFSAANVPVNLTNCVIRGGARKVLGADVLVPLNIEYLARSVGVYKFGFTKAQTAAMTCGLDIKSKESEYQWELEFEDSAGVVIPLFYGLGLVSRRLLNGI